MEFNDYLQKTLSHKEALLQRMRAELSELRGPLPSDDLNEDTFETVGLVSICVPSAFLTGANSCDFPKAILRMISSLKIKSLWCFCTIGKQHVFYLIRIILAVHIID